MCECVCVCVFVVVDHMDQAETRSQRGLDQRQPSSVCRMQTRQLARLDCHVEPLIAAHLELQKT